ncbi:predicted sugar phosphatases of the HAD superfamily [Aromatoleum aromaticum EbN1]|uniref:Predicted sugar phosphatases of the HAD superfamily n=1 Tax=Aromatoleum aromaticum (strain DSM 19018 / LMG 30748 / EbN1) TaxID=76114 RepID=Q5P8S4_AROAE|nr:HAD hydrolase-like protein [Aromatoleum aromaticum]CAI06285.1 predicted sugar phosphatases of the HAD superfamily [Aromatoleum aromaticum EbN1]
MRDDSVAFAGQNIPEAALTRLGQTRGFVFDMDGTLLLGNERNHDLKPLPGALEITHWLTERGIPFAIFTNGTTRPPEEYAAMLGKLGFALPDEAMMTPASSAVDLFVQRGYKRVLVLGGDGLAMPLRKAGIEVVAPVGKPQADAVMIGWYREFTMNNLEAACYAVWGGAQAYSASQALFFATAAGKTLGTSRAISAMLKDLTGCRVQVVGKPSIHALKAASRGLGVRLKDMAVVGDDPELEVPMAHRGRSLAIAVNTGLGNADSFSHLPPTRGPHLTVHGVDELLRLLQRQAL